jgi:type II secretory pathway pseudopilin PulG
VVEVVAVALVIAIIAAVVVPYLAGANDSAAMAGARMVASDLQYAQDAAIVTQTNVTVTFDVGDESYSLSNQSGALIHPITKNVYTIDFATDRDLSGLDIVSAFGGIGSVTFDPTGDPSAGGTVVLQAGDQTYRVMVDAVTGTVTVTVEAS